jgi:putative membrane protein
MGMGGPTMHGWGTWGGGGATAAPGWVLLASLLSRLFVVAAVVGVGYLLYRAIAGNADERDDALAELRLAYARGDLSDEEFERRRERLRREE